MKHKSKRLEAQRGRTSTPLVLAVLVLAGAGIWWITRSRPEVGAPSAGARTAEAAGERGSPERADPLRAPAPARSRPAAARSRPARAAPPPPAPGTLDQATAERIHEWETTFLDPNTTSAQKLAALEELVKNPWSREHAYQEIREVVINHPEREVVEGALDIAAKYPSESLDPFALEEAFETRFHQDLAFRLKVIRALGANRRFPQARQVLEALHRRFSSGILQEAIQKALGMH